MSYTYSRRNSWLWMAAGLGLLLWLCMAPTAYAADINVTSTADNTTSGDGLCTLREAVNNANANGDTTAGDCEAGTYLPVDRIFLPSGVYTLTPGMDNTNEHGDLDILSMGGSLRLIGSGATSTTISGPGYVVGTDRILHTGVDFPAAIIVELYDLTLRNGHAPQGGGAIRVDGTYALVEDSIIQDCEAVYAGGMSNNGNGGAIYMNGGNLVVQSSQLLSNTARAGVVADVQGGAIHATNGAVVYVVDSILRNNKVTVTETSSGRTSAGAIYFDGSDLLIRRSEIVSNSVSALFVEGKGFAGAIYFSGSSMRIDESTVAQNAAGEAGGALYSDGRVEISRSTFSDNRATHGYGGAIVSWNVMTITNSTFSGNVSLWTAGAISNNASGELFMLNTTVSNNTCATEGGLGGGACGVYTWGVVARVQNSVFAGNHDMGSGRVLSPDASGSFTTLGHNLIGIQGNASGFIDGINGDMVGTGSSPLDALLQPLADYGGRTETHLQQWGSPTIDAGDTAACPPVDQRGIPRPQGAACDIGATEQGRPAFLPMLQR